MNHEYGTIEFVPNDFYERLINLRRANPEAFARFAHQTNQRLQAYEEAKVKAGSSSSSQVEIADSN